MTAIRIATGGLAVVMAITVAAGIIAGGFSEEGEAILGLAWGRVTLIDLYVGLILFGLWVLIRERSWVVAPWFVAFLLLGNLATAVYAFWASLRSDSMEELLIGD